MDTATQTETDGLKTAFERFFQKAAEATGKIIGNKIAEKNCKTKIFTCWEFKKC